MEERAPLLTLGWRTEIMSPDSDTTRSAAAEAAAAPLDLLLTDAAMGVLRRMNPGGVAPDRAAVHSAAAVRACDGSGCSHKTRPTSSASWAGRSADNEAEPPGGIPDALPSHRNPPRNSLCVKSNAKWVPFGHGSICILDKIPLSPSFSML